MFDWFEVTCIAVVVCFAGLVAGFLCGHFI